jgi:hypothetical protein
MRRGDRDRLCMIWTYRWERFFHLLSALGLMSNISGMEPI